MGPPVDDGLGPLSEEGENVEAVVVAQREEEVRPDPIVEGEPEASAREALERSAESVEVVPPVGRVGRRLVDDRSGEGLRVCELDRPLIRGCEVAGPEGIPYVLALLVRE